MEIWKDIEGYEGYYMVSSDGRLKSLGRIVKREKGGDYSVGEKLISIPHDRKGYSKIALSKDGKKEWIWLHRIVARHFPEICGEWFEGCIVDHLDTDPKNNKAINLKVGTSRDNANNPITHVHRVECQKKKVIQYTKDGEFIAVYDSASDAALYTKASQQNISRCCLGKRKTAGGFVWKFKKITNS